MDVVCTLSAEMPNLRLRLIGNGDKNFINKLKLKTKSINNTRLLEFIGFVDKKELPEEFSKAHLFAAPSYYEGGPGFVYLEAMACGLPVIGCNGSGVEEIIESGKNGLLVSPNNKIELKAAFRKLMENSEFANKIAHSGREYVLKYADKNACIKKIEELYFDIIDQSNEFNARYILQNSK